MEGVFFRTWSGFKFAPRRLFTDITVSVGTVVWNGKKTVTYLVYFLYGHTKWPGSKWRRSGAVRRWEQIIVLLHVRVLYWKGVAFTWLKLTLGWQNQQPMIQHLVNVQQIRSRGFFFIYNFFYQIYFINYTIQVEFWGLRPWYYKVLQG